MHLLGFWPRCGLVLNLPNLEGRGNPHDHVLGLALEHMIMATTGVGTRATATAEEQQQRSNRWHCTLLHKVVQHRAATISGVGSGAPAFVRDRRASFCALTDRAFRIPAPPVPAPGTLVAPGRLSAWESINQGGLWGAKKDQVSSESVHFCMVLASCANSVMRFRVACDFVLCLRAVCTLSTRQSDASRERNVRS